MMGIERLATGKQAGTQWATHRGGWPRIHPYDGWRARAAEAWWVLTGRFTLHRAWQSGYDDHIRDESGRRARGGR